MSNKRSAGQSILAMVAGLFRLLGDGEAYTFESLSSPYLVFEPLQLLKKSTGKKLESFGAYGVDLLHAKAVFEEDLKDILRCGLRPIFISGGIVNRSTLAFKVLARFCFQAIKDYDEDDRDVAAAEYDLLGHFYPSAYLFVTDCLQDLDLRCVQLSYDSMPGCLGIAYHLDCPIASMSSEYCVTSRPTVLPEEIPPIVINELRFVNLTADFYHLDEGVGKTVPKLKVFHPELSVLRRVPATSRPLIALLMDTNLFPRLPAAIKFDPSGSEPYTLAKLRAVIDWVAENSLTSILQQIMGLITDPGYTNYVLSNILMYLSSFCPDFAEASKVLKILGLREGVSLVKAPTKGVKEERKHQHRGTSPTFFVQTAAGMLRGTGRTDRPVDFLHRWPAALVHLYRFTMLKKLFIIALYSKLGLNLNCSNGYLAELPCIFGPSRILRYLHYCLIMGVEKARGLTYKLVGLRPHAKELCYEGNFRYKTYMIEVKPMGLARSCSVDDFIYKFIGLDCGPDVPSWSVALVLLCVLWHQQKLEHWDCDIAECPLVLSVLVLAVATHHNLGCGASAVANHYDALKALATAKMEESGTFPNPTVEKELMHSALELMAVHEHYVSLCRLLTALQEGSRIPDLSSAAYNRFSPSYEMFPSLALLVYMAAHLKCEATPSVVAMRLWVVHAFLRTNIDANDGARLKDTSTVFSTLLKCVSTVKLTLAAPKVKVTDPPPYFLPKNERPLRRSHSSARHEVPLKPRGNSVAAVMQNGGERS